MGGRRADLGLKKQIVAAVARSIRRLSLGRALVTLWAETLTEEEGKSWAGRARRVDHRDISPPR